MTANSSFDKSALSPVLERCRVLVLQSEDSIWSSMDTKDIVERLDYTVQRLENFLPVEIGELKLLFAATGPLQETALRNNWDDDFLILARRFDEIIG